MSKKELHTKLLELGKKGYLTKQNIRLVIKDDFIENYISCRSLDSLYTKLAKRYKLSKRTIQSICAN